MVSKLLPIISPVVALYILCIMYVLYNPWSSFHLLTFITAEFLLTSTSIMGNLCYFLRYAPYLHYESCFLRVFTKTLKSLGAHDHVHIMLITCKNRRAPHRTRPRQYLIGGNTRGMGQMDIVKIQSVWPCFLPWFLL